MWWWVLGFTLLATAGVGVLGVLSWRLYRKARELGRTVAEASQALATATDALERASGGARRPGDRA